MPEDDVTEATAIKILTNTAANKPFHYLHKSLLLALFYAALIMTAIQPGTAAIIGTGTAIGRRLLQPFSMSDEDAQLAKGLIDSNVTVTDNSPRLGCTGCAA